MIFNCICVKFAVASSNVRVNIKIIAAGYCHLFLQSMCHGITISPPVDLSAPVALLRPLALVTLGRDAVQAYSIGDVVCKQLSPGP